MNVQKIRLAPQHDETTLRQEEFVGVDGSRIILSLDLNARVHEIVVLPGGPSLPGLWAPEPDAPPASPPVAPVITHMLIAPRPGRVSRGCPVGMEWRGRIVSIPPVLEPFPEGGPAPICRRWIEDGDPMLQLAHPTLGLTVDYTLRRLLRLGGRDYALLELPRGLRPADGGEEWTLAGIPDQTRLRALRPEEVAAFLSAWNPQSRALPLLATAQSWLGFHAGNVR